MSIPNSMWRLVELNCVFCTTLSTYFHVPPSGEGVNLVWVVRYTLPCHQQTWDLFHSGPLTFLSNLSRNWYVSKVLFLRKSFSLNIINLVVWHLDETVQTEALLLLGETYNLLQLVISQGEGKGERGGRGEMVGG